jgi:hypothetical protein
MKKTITTIAAVIGIALITTAQDATTTKFSLEIDPATFAFKGYGVHLRIQPKKSQHYLFGIGAYAMDMPDVLVNFNKKNKDKGWKVRLNQGASIFGEYHFSQVNSKWFLGMQLGIQEHKVTHTNYEESIKFKNILAMGYFGYSIKPFKNNLYIKPWAGIGYTSKISGNNRVETTEYDIAPITTFATLHVGYTF